MFRLALNRAGRPILFACVGAFIGLTLTRISFTLVCYLVNEEAWEHLWGAWSSIVFTAAYGIAGAISGAGRR